MPYDAPGRNPNRASSRPGSERGRAGPVGGPHLSPAPLALVVYALCGDGRGHASRARAVASALRARGHRVRFAADVPAYDRIVGDGYRVPTLRQVMRGNRVRLWATARANLDKTWRAPEIIAGAEAWLERVGADLVVADHEPFLPRAARRLGVPVVALSHQLLLTETRAEVPARHALSALGTALGIRILAPPRPEAVVVPSFFFPPLRRGSRATLVPPILRRDVLEAQRTEGDRVLVYLNEGDGMAPLLDTLAAVDAPFDVYGLDPALPAPPNVALHRPSRSGFLGHLAAARAVVATAGFTLLSEALHLGVPVLALPNRGFFEQVVNARAIEAEGRGEAVVGRALRADDLAGFLARAGAYRRDPAPARVGRLGAARAADAIEAVLDAEAAPAPVAWAAAL